MQRIWNAWRIYLRLVYYFQWGKFYEWEVWWWIWTWNWSRNIILNFYTILWNVNSITWNFSQDVHAAYLLDWWRSVLFQKTLLIKEVCWKCCCIVHSAWTCGRRLILLIRITFWEVTNFLATFLEVAYLVTGITFGILGSAFFLMFLVVRFTTSKALLLGACRTGILLIRRFPGFLVVSFIWDIVYLLYWLILKVELVDASICKISMTSLRVMASPLWMILSLALLDSQPIINASLIILLVEWP